MEITIQPNSTPGKILYSVLFIIGLGLCGYGIQMLNDANESKKWPQSEGVVTSSEIIKSSDSDGTSYRAKITYNYQVDDKTYSSNKISFGEYSSPNKNKAQDIIDKFPVGNVTVFYDPEDPARSVLEPGVA